MSPVGQLPLIIAVALAGIAAACWVSAPGARLRRLGFVGDPMSGIAGPRAGQGRSSLAAALAARPDSLVLRTRCLIGASAGMVVVLCWQSLMTATAATWLACPLVAAGVVVLLGRLESPESRRRRLRMIKDLPHQLELIAAAMEAGLPLRGAVQAVVTVSDGPLTEDLAGVLTSIDVGVPDVDAWRALHDHPALGRVCVDLARSIESGTMVVGTLRRHAVVARRRRSGALEAQAKTVGVKSVPPLVFCFVPAFLLVSIVPAAVTALQDAIF
jgi:hypothetical protein